jgi:membrane protease subunit HflC
MKLTLPLGILILLLVVMAGRTYYTVDETEQVVITQFGAPVGETITEAGLHFKWPWRKANYFAKNILEWDGDPSQIPTLDKTFIWVDIFARWRIVDALRFFEKVNNELAAQSQLDSVLNAATRNMVQSHPLIELVRDSNRKMEVLTSPIEGRSDPIVTQVEVGRGQLMLMVLQQSEPKMKELGIQLVDVRVKRINYIKDVQERVFERMVAERKQIAEKFRSEGQGEREKIEGRREKELKTIQAEAYRRSEEIKGKADAEAAGIYSAAYGQDPEFYSLVKTLDLYKSLPEKEIDLIISTDSEFFKYLKGITP